MLPVDWEPQTKTSPVFHYPYDRSRETLDRLARSGPIHPARGVKMQFTNPATGGYAMPTIGAFIQLLPKGFRGTAERVTDGTIYHVVEGAGRTTIGDHVFDWRARDVFVAPSWLPVVARGRRRRGAVQLLGPAGTEGARAVAVGAGLTCPFLP